MNVSHEKTLESEIISLDSGKLLLVFNAANRRLVLSHLSDGKTDWLQPNTKDTSLWSLSFTSPNDTDLDVTSNSASLSSTDTTDNSAAFTWTTKLGENTALVTAKIRIEENNPLSYWSFDVKLPDGWKVTRAAYPIIPSIDPNIACKLAAPAGWGMEYTMKPDTGYEAIYPSCTCTMQFVAFYGTGRGLYIGNHDYEANHKVLSAKNAEDSITYTCTNWPAIPEKSGGIYSIPFETAVGVFDGDYYHAAQIYREFALSAKWSQAGPMSRRPIPQWVKDTDLWLKTEGNVGEHLESCQKAVDFFGAPISIHAYRWHQIPYDTLYPDYFPPLDGFAENIKKLQEMGLHVMPYINGRLCDPNSKGWNEEGLSESAVRDEKGDYHTEVYGSKVPLSPQCPYTEAWQNKVAGLVDRLITELDVNGVYIDQIGAAYPYRCFNPEHGHQIGGGDFWVKGYRKMLEKVRAKVPKDRMITTEENAECWLDQFDGQLVVNTNTVTGRPLIPLFPAVYSGRVIMFGFQYLPKDDIDLSLPFIAKMAQGFVFGGQLGWVDANKIMAPEAAKEADFLRNLTRCRRFGHQFLLTGRFLGMVEAKGDNPRLSREATGVFGGTYIVDIPAVLASTWEAEDGSIGVVIANMSDQDRAVEVNAPLKPNKSYKMEVFGPEGRTSESETQSSIQKVTVPTRGAMILSLMEI